MGVVGRLVRAELYRVVHERQFLLVLAIIVALFQFMYMGETTTPSRVLMPWSKPRLP